MKLLIWGVGGKMGKVVLATAQDDKDIEIVGGIDKFSAPDGVKVYQSADSLEVKPDVIIDFSRPEALNDILDYALRHKIAVVLATTGYTAEQNAQIDQAAKLIPVFTSRNMSLGINLLADLVKKAAEILGEQFDIEVIEMHHNQKVDSPSGTAMILAEAANQGCNNAKEYSYGRHSAKDARKPSEIGIHSVRGGTIVGEHEVLFAGKDETISLSHSASSKQVFAVGAIKAAKFLQGKAPARYTMQDLFN